MMPIDLDEVNGSIEASVVDDNFEKLEVFLKENVGKEDFNEKFNKYKIRRFTSGKISSFNTGSNPYSSPRDSSITGLFENNWNEVSEVPTFREISKKDIENIGETDSDSRFALKEGEPYGSIEPRPNAHIYSMKGRPTELLGFPGGNLCYDFQEQGIPNLDEVHGETIENYPPKEPLQSAPKDECWSMWLTVPDAAGSVYVDEPCVALITATVRGNYFFTPAIRTVNQDLDKTIYNFQQRLPAVSGAPPPPEDGDGGDFNYFATPDHSGLFAIKEGQDQSAFLRLGLFVDTNPNVYDDEFFNGDEYGRPTMFGHGYNPWIGDDPKGTLEAEKPDGVAFTRSWVKVKEITYRVRQTGTYTITAAIELKGRRKYNFSLKFRPAGYYGYIEQHFDTVQKKAFVSGISELHNPTRWSDDDLPIPLPEPRGSSIWNSYHNDEGKGYSELGNHYNPSWLWGTDPLYHTYMVGKTSGFDWIEGWGVDKDDPVKGYFARPWNQNWLWPGADSLVTNFVQSSSLGVEFFYGQSQITSDPDTIEFTTNDQQTGKRTEDLENEEATGKVADKSNPRKPFGGENLN